jgi:hypothetical protein
MYATDKLQIFCKKKVCLGGVEWWGRPGRQSQRGGKMGPEMIVVNKKIWPATCNIFLIVGIN